MVPITFALLHDLMQTAATYLRSFSERFPIRGTHLIEKESLRFKELDHVLIEKVERLFREHALGSPGQTTSAFTISATMAVTPIFGLPSPSPSAQSFTLS
jgi:hypothetical protein